MHKLFLTIILSTFCVAPAIATIPEQDITFLFGQQTHLPELAPLSPQEMQQTEGAVIPLPVLMTVSAIAAGASYWHNAAPQANWGAALLAMATGATAPLGIPGIGIATFGSMAAGEIRPRLCMRGGPPTPC